MSAHIGEITEFGLRPNRARALGVQLDEGLSALVEPLTEELNERAKEWARRIADQVQATTIAEVQISALRTSNDVLADQLRKAQARINELEDINEAAISGRRRFFGPVLMRPARPGAWDGEVWLLDPEKGERGLGPRFASVAEVRALHPELWVVTADADGVLLDAWNKEG